MPRPSTAQSVTTVPSFDDKALCKPDRDGFRYVAFPQHRVA